MALFEETKQAVIRDLEGLPPNTRLPARSELSEKYYVSRNTIDRIIESLCREGYLYTIRNSGTFVADPSIDMNIVSPLAPETIGVVMPTSGINSSVMIERAIQDYATAYNLNVQFCITGHDPRRMESYIRRLLLLHVSGLLIQPPSQIHSYAEISMDIQKAKVPAVFMFGTFPSMADAPLVTCNNPLPDNVDFLYERGYQRPGYVSNHGNLNSDSMLRMFISALAKRGEGSWDTRTLVESYLERSAFIQRLIEFLQREEAPDAVLCFNDTEASMVYEAARTIGRSIPDDLAVIGSDNSPAAALMDPPLTSIDIGAYDIGLTAIGWITRIVRNGIWPKNTFKVFEREMVERSSCRSIQKPQEKLRH